MHCYCHFCGTPVRFHIARAGETVNCFNCSIETVLFIPGIGAPYTQDQYPLEAKEIAWGTNQFGVRHLTGVVVNKSLKNFDWVRIEFILFNKAGLPVGSTSDCLLNFGAQKSWKFRAPVSQPEVLRASQGLLSCEYGRVNPLYVAAQADLPKTSAALGSP